MTVWPRLARLAAMRIDEDPPLADDDAFARLVRWQNGIISRLQALRFVSARSVQHAVERQRWRRVHWGIYQTQPGLLDLPQRQWVAVLAAGADLPGCEDEEPACLGGLSALQLHGLRHVKANAIHVLVPASRRVRAPERVIVHRTRLMPQRWETRHVRPPATLAGRSVVDAAAWARSDEEARLIVTASFQQRIVTLRDIENAAGAMVNAPRRRLVLRTAWDCDGGSHSLTELDLVQLCRKAGLPVPTRQVQRTDRAGRTRYLDALFEPWKVAIEIDGAHHLNVHQMWDDAIRQNSLELAGYVVLRYPAHVIREHPERVVAEIREALMMAGWRP
jgi:very-short-patch-repair endonuclease